MIPGLDRWVSVDTDGEDEAILLERLAERNPEAMAELYERYAKLVYLKLNQIVNDPAAAEDLVQEVFLTIWKRAGELDPKRGNLKAWLRTTAHNRAVDYLRWKRLRAAPVGLDMAALVIPDLLTDLDRDIEGRDQIRALERALAKLTARHQEVITLAFYHNLSHSEMAESLRKPLGTVKAWMRQALVSLRKELGETQSMAPASRVSPR